MTVTHSAERLTWLCNTVPALIEQIEEADFSFKPSPAKWSKKEILGHLIDSAANNHQRFIRIQFENEPVIFYEQNQWVALSNYAIMDSARVIQFWTSYNLFLVEVITQVPEENLSRYGTGRDGQKYTLKFYIEDYVEHMEHHLRQIVSY